MKTRRSLVLTVSFSLTMTALALAQNEHAFLWDSVNGMQDLGTLGGNTSYALQINDSGVVVGYSYLSDNITTHAFTWTASGGMVDIGASFPGGGSTQGIGINSSGNVSAAGSIGTVNQQPAFFTSPNLWQSLPGKPNSDERNFGYGINDSNQVTGQQYFGEVEHAFIWEPTTGTRKYLTHLSNGLHTGGNAINNLGHVAGNGSAPGAFVAVLWKKPMKPLVVGRLNGDTYTAGEGINDNDEVVGLNGALAGFYWNSTVRMVALQTLGGTQAPAFGINSSGVIAGYSTTASGATHAALWSNYTSAPTDLGTLPGGTNSYGRGLNNAGQVVGYADVP